jgi:uncharacterized repeat protein (TIGR02543 family)
MAVSVRATAVAKQYSYWSTLTLTSVSATRDAATPSKITVTIKWTFGVGDDNPYGSPSGSWKGFQYSGSGSGGSQHGVSGNSGTYTYSFTDTNYASHTGKFKYYAGVTGEGHNAEEEKTYTYTIPADTSTVSFNANGGGTPSPASKAVTYGSTYGTLATCAWSGYTFLGWYTAASGGTKISSGTTVSVTANQTLYAHWDANANTLTFDANEGDCPEDVRIVDTGQKYGALPQATRTGYTFNGWYTARTGGTEVTADTTMVVGGATVYAHWTANTYTITFNPNGGTVDTDSKPVTYDQPFGELPTPVRSGYDFQGWFTAATDGEEIHAEDTVKITNSRADFAQWEAMSILHLVSGDEALTITNIKVVAGETVKNVIGCYSVEDGVVRQGI